MCVYVCVCVCVSACARVHTLIYHLLARVTFTLGKSTCACTHVLLFALSR